MLTIGSLFSGIGGLDLGLERGLSAAGLEARTIWQVEANPFARAVLARHWPDAVRYDDVRGITTDVGRTDILCGGFPCQDISKAGKGAGLAGEKSGLWREMARIIRDLGPRVIVVENVPALTSRGLGDVLGDLARLGFDAEWTCLSAGGIGAPHIRSRFFAVAYTRGAGWPEHHPCPLAAWVGHCAWSPAAVGLPGWDEGVPGPLAVADGVPRGLVRGAVTAYGNAVVPGVGALLGAYVAHLLSAESR